MQRRPLSPSASLFRPETWRVALLVVGAGLLSSAGAQSNCDTPGNTFDEVYCLSKVLVKADDELNAVYGKLLKRLPAAAQVNLRQTQRSWLARRDSECTGRDSRLGEVIYTGCAVDMTVQRVNFLNARYRECMSSGCQPSKLRR
ncbi:lysozyme inhibitor LprI family protein [Deinococcus malanensis]|uniref:lysozyme inhibitor LprI family protein n=1 Tax=Deinococcus malanensis TaxID=1706855 RepID=UPI00362DBB98